MTEEVMKLMLREKTGETDDVKLSAYLSMAELEILNRMYPYKDVTGLTVPSRYYGVQVEIAAYHLNKRGAEGEVSHSENGITRMYENGDTPLSLLRQITPMAGVPFSTGGSSDENS